MKRIAATAVIGVVAAVLLPARAPAATVAAPSSTTPPATGSTIAWHACRGSVRFDVDKCATLSVPMDYADPTGQQISLALSLVRHTSSAADYKGVMLLNFGGPGEPGLDTEGVPDSVPHGVGGDYDWIGWDPRGVGHSKPSISCDPSYFASRRRSYDPKTKSLLTYWLDRSKAYADACEAKYPDLLQHMTTQDSAEDMESIRQALGVTKISYYGYSYGTYLGQVYSTLYPSHVKRLVLDSNVDPSRIWYDANLDQDRAFDRNADIWFHWVARHHTSLRLGTTYHSVRHRYYRDLARLTKHPKGQLGPDEFVDAFLNVGYYQFTWPDVANAWKAYVLKHNTAPLLRQFRESDTPSTDNTFAVYSAVQCTDTQWPTSWQTWQHNNSAVNAKRPFLTWSNAWFNAPCLFWGASAHTPVTIDGSQVASALLIDQTKDAATPYEGSLEVRSLYPSSRLLAEPGGTTHADSLDGNACVDDTVARYLRSGALPARRSGRRADATCKPLPTPSPDSVFVAAAAAHPAATARLR